MGRDHVNRPPSESINSKIQWVKYTARGFRNFEDFKNAIYLHCGALDLLPNPTQIPEERRLS
jgi:transposase